MSLRRLHFFVPAWSPHSFVSAWRKLTAALLLALLPAGTAAAQDAAPPVFKVNTRIVILDIVVTDKKGNVVNNLKQDDFSIFEDKQPQTIRTFDPPSAHGMPPSPDGKAIVNSAADLPKIGDAPLTILVLDELNTAFTDMAYARHCMQNYLLAQPELLKQPTAMLVASNTKFQLLQDYTQNRAALLQALKTHFPEYPWKLETSHKSGPGVAERMAQTMASLIQIAEATRGSPGRKNIIWVGTASFAVNLVSADSQTIQTMEQLTKRLTQTLLETRVTLYHIDPTINEVYTITAEDPDDDDDPFADGITFNKFATATGGQIYASRNDVDNEIANSIDNGNSYYTLSYSPSNSNEDAAKYRSIKIKLSNPDLIATTREGYYPEAANANNSVNDTTLSANQRKSFLELDLSQAALSILPYNALTITAQKSTDPSPDPHVWDISVPAANLAWTPQPSGELSTEVTAMAVSFNDSGNGQKGKYRTTNKSKVLGHAAHEFQSTKKPGEDVSGTVTFQLPVDIPSATTRIRFILRDAITGKIGTIDVKP